MSRWRRLILTVLMVAVSTMIVVPFFALLTTDFGDPLEVRWEELDKNQDGEESESQPDSRKAVIEFGEADSFDWSYLWLLIPLVLGLGVVYVLAVGRLEEGTDFEDWLAATGIVQAALFLVCVGMAVANNYYFDVADRLAVAIEDEELAAKALKRAFANQTVVVICAAGCLAMGDIIIVLVAFGTDSLFKTVVNSYARYKERLTESLGGVSGTLSLCPGGTVEQPGYVCRMRWWPFPALVLRREVFGEVCRGGTCCNYWPDLSRNSQWSYCAGSLRSRLANCLTWLAQKRRSKLWPLLMVKFETGWVLVYSR